MEVLDKIRQELERGFTKRELEVLMGIPKNNLSGILKGGKKISAKGLIRINKYFELETLPIPSEKIEKVKRMVIENNNPANKARIEAERNNVKELPQKIIKQPLIVSEMSNSPIESKSKEMPSGLSKSEMFKWIKNNS